MLRILLSISSIPISSMLIACTPSPQKAAMPSPSHVSGTTVQSSGGPPSSSGRGVWNPEPEAEAIAKKSAPGPLGDSPAEAQGRLILSTAFVRLGAGGHLTVELRNGHVLALRDVVMRARDYCGVQVAGDPARAKYCGGYAEVAAARPGGAQTASSAAEPAPGPPAAK